MASTVSTETAEAPPFKIKPLVRSAMAFFESRNSIMTVTVAKENTAATIVQSAQWSVISDQLRPFDRIVAIWEDRSTYAELLVLDAGRGYANLQLLNYWPLPVLLVSEAGLPPGFDCFYAGPLENDNGGYCVKRLADGVLMVKGKSSRDAALAELLDSATLR